MQVMQSPALSNMEDPSLQGSDFSKSTTYTKIKSIINTTFQSVNKVIHGKIRCTKMDL